MKYSEKTKQAVKDLYIRGGKTQREISAMLDIPASTIAAWAKKEAWEQEKAAIAISVDTLVPKILSKINSDIDNGELSADSLAKYCKQLRELNRAALTINDYHQVMVKFIDYMRLQAGRDSEINSQVLKIVVGMQDDFLKSLANE